MIPEPLFEMREDYLFIKPSGDRRSLMEVVESSQKLTQLASAFKTNKVLADYTDVHFKLPMTEAFNLVRLYENRMHHFKEITLSVIVNKETYEIGKFWERICQKRGFNNAVYLNEKEATAWLLSKSHSS